MRWADAGEKRLWGGLEVRMKRCWKGAFAEVNWRTVCNHLLTKILWWGSVEAALFYLSSNTASFWCHNISTFWVINSEQVCTLRVLISLCCQRTKARQPHNLHFLKVVSSGSLYISQCRFSFNTVECKYFRILAILLKKKSATSDGKSIAFST